MEIGAITFRNDILNGEAIFTNTHIPIKTLFNSLDSGDSLADFLKDFPEVSAEQVVEVLGYARRLITSQEVIKANGTLLNITDNPFIPTSAVLQFEKAIELLINEHRNSVGLLPFTFNSEVSTIARIHSMEVAKNTAPNDHTGWELRIAQAAQIVRGGGGAENLATGFNTAPDVLQAWLNEPGHKQNIESSLKFAGIGVASFRGGPNFFTLLIL